MKYNNPFNAFEDDRGITTILMLKSRLMIVLKDYIEGEWNKLPARLEELKKTSIKQTDLKDLQGKWESEFLANTFLNKTQLRAIRKGQINLLVLEKLIYAAGKLELKVDLEHVLSGPIDQLPSEEIKENDKKIAALKTKAPKPKSAADFFRDTPKLKQALTTVGEQASADQRQTLNEYIRKIALPDRGLVVTSPQRFGKTTLMYAYLKELAVTRSNAIKPKILVICDTHGFIELHENRDDHGIRMENIQIIRMEAKAFPDVADYDTVVFAITLNAEREAYYPSSDAYEEFVLRLNSRDNPPFTMILVDSN